jgi:hypothetical protein
MTNLTLAIPDDLALRLERTALTERKTIEQLLIERLPSLIAGETAASAGSPAAVLQATLAPPYPTADDIDALEKAISSATLPVKADEIFPE